MVVLFQKYKRRKIMVLANYQPREVLKHFEAISEIPRGSGNEKAVSDFILQFARNLGCKVVQDKLSNLVIYKPASPGYEEKPAVILQAHLDMVCEKNADTVHDFLKDPIKLYVEGDFIKARGTTLGADNGLGVALCMAVLEDKNLTHPPIEIVLTVEEETGMAGAYNIDAALLSGTRMLNLDNSRGLEIIMGCAAGTTVEYIMSAKWEEVPADAAVFALNVKGLTGGHSGGDINKGRGNALRILGNILGALARQTDTRIAEINGGMKLNAIPREAYATITIPNSEIEKAFGIIEKCKTDFATQYRAADSGLEIFYTETNAEKVLTGDCVKNLIASLMLFPNGVLHMSTEIEGFVNASCNLGVVETLPECIKIYAMPRGAAKFYNEQTEGQISLLAKLTDAEVTFMQRSPAWPYNPNSKLMKLAQLCYEPVFGHKAEITAVHAGLECGLFAEKLPQELDIISFGPTNIDLHTPDERLSISSTVKSWAFLKELLKAL
jgi:dipeptidase D